ncbi:3-hydroxyisobutyryl-CoA hydrolase [Galactobacter caseinivorans]|uniref:3-hydroxyisobutyryl-CoA hydrolase n=1 Tax=Galactobacter caseinivorans TaxID=2676123 RepID=A0A496PHF9_9MICC|nr:3-hydroxyisobutyryl-CoA hydrolase [Galactobacter caseinivorans]RKW69918.1 enoyl-CoA hydratase/isomerase family protein [Galactobacter caseinivorans]
MSGEAQSVPDAAGQGPSAGAASQRRAEGDATPSNAGGDAARPKAEGDAAPSSSGTGRGAEQPSSGNGPPVHFEVRGALGLITLNRPRAVNALTHEMVLLLWAQLVRWAHDPAVERVAIRGGGERGLCAGGDVVAIYRDITREDRTPETPFETMGFWRDEYRLNLLISRYPKPYIALMDGLVLGGGIGVSAHGSHRVVTERTRSGLPETQIGFSPDVGGTYLLGHAPGAAGAHAALTGAHLDAGDALYLGLADYCVPAASLEELLSALETTAPEQALEALAVPHPESTLQAASEWIEPAYAAPHALAVVQALEASDHPDAVAAAAVIRSKSPTSVAVALAAVRAGGDGDLAQALQLEWRAGYRFLGGHDFAEGIRAQVVDKDRNPAWEPATLEQLDLTKVTDHYLAPLPNVPLDLSPVDVVVPPA